MEKKFFKLIRNAYGNPTGRIDVTRGGYPIAYDGEPVENWENMLFTLKDGVYSDFSPCVSHANLVSVVFKEIIEKFIPEDYPIEFLPVPVESEQYGNRQYYIMHFTKIFDVIDKKHTDYVDGTDYVTKMALDYNKCKDLHVFNTRPVVNDVIVSGEVRRMLRKYKLDLGIEFWQIHSYE